LHTGLGAFPVLDTGVKPDNDSNIKNTLDTQENEPRYGAEPHLSQPIIIFKIVSSIMKCNTWESRKEVAILSVYGKTI